MKKLLKAVALAILGYITGAVGGMFLIGAFSSNHHDRLTEAAMTSIFVIGPAWSLLTFIVALVFLPGKRSRPDPAKNSL
jgi:cation transporter-like permease